MKLSAENEFEAMRPTLMGIAYRLLGTRNDAEDAVQDVFIRWYEQQASANPVDNPQAWLTKVCTNRCLDILKSAHHKRMTYVGPWLPEPLQTEMVGSTEETAERGNSLDYAFMVVLERLSPKERAAYLLREIFDRDYGEVADILAISEVNCRKIVSRARRRVSDGSVRVENSATMQKALLVAFRKALHTGDTRSFANMLSRSIELHADGGGKVVAAQDVLRGDKLIVNFVRHGLYHAWRRLDLIEVQVNGGPGLLLRRGEEIVGCVTCEIDGDNHADRLFILRNPEKLAQLGMRSRVDLMKGEISF
ncbi:RNA polymerase sigma factor SigJ [Marimonas arenosa]|uniref:RNA polymerase sigma factor SigJ n=1 Tax=Marimonas arenosa TaxID=1795305 RepID=A0AAE3WBM7_9RHOB|nr:RNA polymerase sigma factor SigJ [Marimonas arenosa]MDQ2088720.1 RNA polymerase sigma factor SigJ [Marimonas arenosa]